jgi:hypothetical protein
MPNMNAVNGLFCEFHGEFESIVMDTVSDKIEPYLLDRMFEDFDNLQEIYHDKLKKLCEKEGENNG